MTYRCLHVNPEHYYSVGEDESTGRPVMEVVITAVGWYSLYFWLTEEEMQAFRADPDALTDLSHRMAVDKGKHHFKNRLIQPAAT